MKWLRRLGYGLMIAAAANMAFLSYLYGSMLLFSELLLLPAVVFICVIPLKNIRPEKSLYSLEKGCELLRLFLISTVVTASVQFLAAFVFWRQMLPWDHSFSWSLLLSWLGCLLAAVLVEALVFWSGMIRLYVRSRQLGIKHRVIGALLGFIPIANLVYLIKMIRIVDREVETESSKTELNLKRKDQRVCKTRYPLFMVHGVFFRDTRFLNYWGRIPDELIQNGAVIYYGEQQSADSVEDCGKELAERIRGIVESTGCGKVNVIAHSKGGLDMRAAISHYGAGPYVASLTTINTPHRGCLFAEYLLEKIPGQVKEQIASTYNRTLYKLGDTSPDFMKAVTDLTAYACQHANEVTPDVDGVYYQSVMSYCRKAGSGKFPLNISYPLVKHFDGKNDGLVAVESAAWGQKFTLVEPKGKRGISHGDMIDLNRENIEGFDVREFYVDLVHSLKEKQF